MENEFVWTDELVFEFTNFYDEYAKNNKITWTSVVVEEFKKSKSKELSKERPPIGIKPEWLCKEERLEAIDAAISRHKEVECSIPESWLMERMEIIYWLDDHEKSKELSKEKDYEILSISSKKDGAGWTCDKTGFEYYLKNGYEICQVKRLPDGEIFTIGEITGGNNKIHEFKIEQDLRLTVVMQSFLTNIQSLTKLKEPIALFTTEDGVEIHRGDSYVKVNNYSDYSVVTGFVAEDNQDNYKGLKFSTEEKAKNWVSLNKVLFSAKEIFSVSAKYGFSIVAFENDIQDLVKQKING